MSKISMLPISMVNDADGGARLARLGANFMGNIIKPRKGYLFCFEVIRVYGLLRKVVVVYRYTFLTKPGCSSGACLSIGVTPLFKSKNPHCNTLVSRQYFL